MPVERSVCGGRAGAGGALEPSRRSSFGVPWRAQPGDGGAAGSLAKAGSGADGSC